MNQRHRKINPNDVPAIRQLRSTGMALDAIGALYNVSGEAIRQRLLLPDKVEQEVPEMAAVPTRADGALYYDPAIHYEWMRPDATITNRIGKV